MARHVPFAQRDADMPDDIVVATETAISAETGLKSGRDAARPEWLRRLLEMVFWLALIAATIAVATAIAHGLHPR